MVEKVSGQLRLTRMNDRDVTALNLFFAIRHYKHPHIDQMVDMLGYNITPEDNTLFGEYGEDGEFLIPSICRHAALERINPAAKEWIRSDDVEAHEALCEEHLKIAQSVEYFAKNINGTPGSCPLLWLNYRVWNPEGDQYTYLTWDRGEKTYDVYWALLYISTILERMNPDYHFIEGSMACDNENGFISIMTIQNQVVVQKVIMEEMYNPITDITWYTDKAWFSKN